MSAGGGAEARRQPLSVTWREWLQSPDWQGTRYAGAPFDAVVVGSGYGGSVAALRLAKKRHRVLLLERGSEYLPGEFPNDFSLVPKFFRINVPGIGVPKGRATGLVEVHLGQGMVAVTGNGLGGGSLVNAGVVMQPDADVFTQPEWPAAIRQGREQGLGRFFRRAGRDLAAADWRSGLPGDVPLDKTAALQRLAAGLGRPVEAARLTIAPDQCRRCGDCASGCNVPGAKRSLDTTYLRRALATGRVQVVTQAEVYRFERDSDGEGRHRGWKLHVFATDAQHQFAATRELFADRQPSATWRTVAAPLLFVCAGTIGSTRLLQRSQSLAAGALRFSPALGTRVSGNGDSVSWVTNEAGHVGGVSRGQAGLDEWEKVGGQPGFDRRRIVGPTITAAIDLRTAAPRRPSQADARLPLHERVVIEDCAIPRAIAQLFRELLATTRTLRQLDGWWFHGPRFGPAGGEDPLAASDLQAQHTQTLLAMGHDGSPARLVWLEGLDSSAPYLPQPETLATYRRQQQIFDGWGLRHVHNPLWEAMPKDAASLMAGPKPPHTVTTVHPLGGCVMSDESAIGVVNDLGQVWVGDPGQGQMPDDATEAAGGAAVGAPGRNAPRLYKGLYVLDGSIVPTSLGCNPLWTITALAERALAAIPRKAPAAPPCEGRHSDARSPRAFPSRDLRIDARLHEVLLGSDVRLRGPLAEHVGAKEVWARLEATFESPDIQAAMRAPSHRTPARGTLVLGGASPGADLERVRYRVADGWFTPLPANSLSSGPALFLRSMLELGVLLVAVVCFIAALAAPFRPGMSLRGALLALVALPASLLLLPLGRSFLTWLVLRGRRDIAERLRGPWSWRGLPAATASLFFAARALLKQLVHASEKRVMRYRLQLQLEEPAPPGLPKTLVLRAHKRVSYRAGIVEVLQWLFRFERAGEAGGRERVPIRPTFWEQVMDAQVSVVPPGWRGGLQALFGAALVRGRLRMGFDNLTSSGLSSSRRNARGAMELGLRGDTTSGILALASYPSLFLRFALKTRLLDFRLPSYSELPVPDRAPHAETSLRMGDHCVLPQLHWLPVERGTSTSDDGSENAAPLKLQLWRYRRPGGRPEIQPGTWMGVQVARAKSVLLLHAFGQSGLSYTLKSVGENLAESFYRRGYEVWILEMRMSSRSGYAGDPCCVDQIARHDIPAAVRHIVQTLAGESASTAPLQISAFAQCIGSAALWMSLLSGALSHRVAAARHAEGAPPQLSMLSHAMFSQVHPWIVGARGTQSKTWMPSLLQVLWRRGAVPFAVRGPQGIFMSGLDRLLASLPVPRGEHRRPQGNDDAEATCRRLRFIEAPLFRHANINDATFAAMNLLFGDANLRLFAHARRFVDREQLVDEDGVNCYVTAENLQRHLCLPVQLLHGEANELFDASSARLSFERLGEVHDGWQQAFCREGSGPAQPLLAGGYGHLDVLIGARAAQEVYPRIVAFFDRCHQAADHCADASPAPAWRVRAPALGPFVGWLREDPARGMLLRISFAVDERAGLAPGDALPPIRVRYPSAALGRLLTLPHALAWKRFGDGQGADGIRGVRMFAWADLPVPPDCAPGEDWQLMTLHPCRPAAQQPALPSPDASDEELDAYLEQLRAQAPPPTVRPPLSEGVLFDAAAAAFRVPREAIDTLAPSARVRLAVGCCRHPGLGVDWTRVDHTLDDLLQRQAEEPVAFAMLLGDQIYADATAGLLDPFSPQERFWERHETAFHRQALGRLLAAMPVYLTADDHEWMDSFPSAGPLVAEPWATGGARQGFGERNEQAIAFATHAMTAFQRLHSPAADSGEGCYSFRHGCARFFVIESRFGRERNQALVADPAVLSKLHRWLREAEAGELLNVVACGSVVLPGLHGNADPANPGVIDTWQYAPEQRAQLLDMLVGHVPGRFLLLSGDYHLSGAGYVCCDGRTVGAAILAPPLYAPMPYANASPDAVDLEQRVTLPRGEQVTADFSQQGRIARGSGFGVLEVRRVDGGFDVDYRRDLRVWERGTNRSWNATLELRPPAG